MASNIKNDIAFVALLQFCRLYSFVLAWNSCWVGSNYCLYVHYLTSDTIISTAMIYLWQFCSKKSLISCAKMFETQSVLFIQELTFYSMVLI